MGVAVEVEGLTKSFGSQNIWSDVTLTLPPGEISVLLGPSGTGKSVFLKSLVGLLKPEKGSIVINDTDIVRTSEHKLYEIRKLFGVLFQDGALFGSMNLFDNIAFPLREHTKKSESEIKRIVLEKMDMVGLQGAEGKLPGEISGGMRKRAGLARALVLDPEIILFDEPDSGLDPVRVAYLNQLIVDLNAQIDATFLIVTHDIGTARTVPDNLGLLFRRNLVDVRPARAAAHLAGARRPAVPQRPPRGPDRHERGEGRRPGRGRDGGPGGARRRLAQRRRPQGRQRWGRRPAAARPPPRACPSARPSAAARSAWPACCTSSTRRPQAAIRAVPARGPAGPGRLRRLRVRPRAPAAGTGRPSPTRSGSTAAARTATLPRQGGEA